MSVNPNLDQQRRKQVAAIIGALPLVAAGDPRPALSGAINLRDQTVAYVRNTRRVKEAAKDALAMPADRIARLMGAKDAGSVLATMQRFHCFIADTDTDRVRWAHELDAWNDFRAAERNGRSPNLGDLIISGLEEALAGAAGRDGGQLERAIIAG
jgi:hypothetical protein